jgi:integrase
MRINPRKRKFTARAKQRPYLDQARQVAALLLAARQLDHKAKRYRHVGRYALVSVLVLGGLRLDEALTLRWRDVDLAGGWLRVKQDSDGKTVAATRKLKLRERLYKAVADHKARSRNTGPDDLVFPTVTGEQHTQSNVRQRIVGKARARADRMLDTPLPAVTPHGLRHTWASILHTLRVPRANVKQEGGWDDARTMDQIYSHPIDPDEVPRMRALMDGTASLEALVEDGPLSLGTEPPSAPEPTRIRPDAVPVG